MSLIKQVFSIIWQSFWGTISGIWPTLDAEFDINHKIIIAVIAFILAAAGVSPVIVKIVKKL